MDFSSSFERKVKYGVLETGAFLFKYHVARPFALLARASLPSSDYSLLRSAKPPPTPRGVKQNYVKDSREIVVSR